MTNLVRFQTTKFLNLKSDYDFGYELSKAYCEIGWTPAKASSNRLFQEKEYQLFIEKIVQEVKNGHSKTENTYCIHLEKYDQSLSTPHLKVVAEALYRSYGIEIKQVDALSHPTKMIVSCDQDNPLFNASAEYMQQARKDGFLTDFNFKFNNKTYPVHKLVLASRCPYFEKMFRGGFKDVQEHTIALEDLQEASFDIFLDYVYTGNLKFTGQSSKAICDLVHLSCFYDLQYLKNKCFEHMCKVVNVDNLVEFLACSQKYEMDELETALLEHVKREVKLENLEQFILLARAHEMKEFEVVCLKETISKFGFLLPNFSKIEELLKLSETYELSEFRNKFESLLNDAVIKLHCALDECREYLDLACQYTLISLQGACQQRIAAILPKEESMSLDEIKSFLTLAHKYPLQRILEACEDQLMSQITTDDFDKIVVLAQKFNLSRLLEACQKFKK